jgi:hypothetical protein
MSEEPPEALIDPDRFPFTIEELGMSGHLYYRLKQFETSSYGGVW